MKVAVILFPGTNFEQESVRACQRSNLKTEVIRWNDNHSKLKNFDAFILPGGFSYEDRGRSGVIAAKDPIMEVITTESKKGKPVIGICNGCQILVEAGLIPDANEERLEMALAWNQKIKNQEFKGGGFYNDWIYIRHNVTQGRSVFNRFSQKVIMRIPVANGEGKFVSRNKNLLKTLIEKEQTIFQYCDKNGKILPDFPINPNGSEYNLAGICNPSGNILAIMPHPEQTGGTGQPIFDSMADFLKKEKKVRIQKSLKKVENKTSFTVPEKKPDIVILSKLIITDNEERTIENTLKQLHFKNVELHRQIYFGFYLQDKTNLEAVAEKLIKSGEIVNLNKEIPTVYINDKVYSFDKKTGLQETSNQETKDGFNYIVTEYSDYVGKNILLNLKNHFHANSLEKVERGVFWKIKEKPEKIAKVLQTNLFHNPNSMKIIAV